MLLRLLIRAANTGAEVRTHAAALAAALWPAQLYACGICWSGEDRINSKLTTPCRRQARSRCSLRRRAESAGGGSASSKCRQSWKSRLQIPVETWVSEGVAS